MIDTGYLFSKDDQRIFINTIYEKISFTYKFLNDIIQYTPKIFKSIKSN